MVIAYDFLPCIFNKRLNLLNNDSYFHTEIMYMLLHVITQWLQNLFEHAIVSVFLSK